VLVDHHAHWFPPAYLEMIEGRIEPPFAVRDGEGGWTYTLDDDPVGGRWNYPPRFTDLDQNLDDMDAGGVQTTVFSPVVMGDVTGRDLAFAKEALGVIHRELAAAQAKHPDRIRAMAMLPLQDTDAAIEVLETAVGDLGMVGVCIGSNLQGASIAPPRLLPLYRRIEELDVPILLHPAMRSTAFDASIKPSSEGSSGGRVADVGLGWVYDTSLAALSLIFNGVLDRCPRLQIIHPHTGGVIPFITGRIDAALMVPATRKEFTLERSVPEYLRSNFYIDFASGSSPTMLELGLQTYGPSRILFGSDFPFHGRAHYQDLLAQLDDHLAAEIRSNRVPNLALPTP
jgi:predicted TIM-barrel fold metal-dependent hydrolase